MSSARMSDVGRWLLGIAVPGDIRLHYLSQLPCAVQKTCSATAEVSSCCDCVDIVISYACPARSGPGVSENFADYGRHTGCFLYPKQ